MPEETVVAAPSAAEETPASTPVGQPIEVQTPQRWKEMDRSRGALVDLTPEQRSEYKKTGTLPKPEAPAPSPKEPQSETQPEADAGNQRQEHTDDKGKKKHQTAEERIAQLEATIERIRQTKEARQERKTETAPVIEQPKPQQQPPQNFQEWRKQFKPSLFIEDYGKANPDASYEDAIAAMNETLDDVRSQFRQAEERVKSSTAQMSQKLADAEKRYGAKFDEVLVPTLKAVNEKIVPAIRQLMEESEVLPHVLFTMGDEEGGVEKFLSMPPGKQARWFALAEALVQEQLAGKTDEVKPEPPAKPQTNAPRPPAEVGGRATSPGDELESAAKSGDFRRFKAEANRRALAQIKG